MELNVNLDYMMDVIIEMGGRKPYPHGCEMVMLGYTKHCGIGIMVWSGDKGWLTDWNNPYIAQNQAHVNVLVPDIDTDIEIPPSNSIIANSTLVVKIHLQRKVD